MPTHTAPAKRAPAKTKAAKKAVNKAARRSRREDLTPWCAPGESVQDMLQRASDRDRD
jgi:hypothetical protein